MPPMSFNWAEFLKKILDTLLAQERAPLPSKHVCLLASAWVLLPHPTLDATRVNLVAWLCAGTCRQCGSRTTFSAAVKNARRHKHTQTWALQCARFIFCHVCLVFPIRRGSRTLICHAILPDARMNFLLISIRKIQSGSL